MDKPGTTRGVSADASAKIDAPPLIYIAGPFRGPTPLAVRHNVERARDFGLVVAAHGGYPVIPHTMTAEFDKQLTDDFWLVGTMELLKRCDGLAALSTWNQSAGAMAEVGWALGHNLPCWPEDSERETLTVFIARVKERMLVHGPQYHVQATT